MGTPEFKSFSLWPQPAQGIAGRAAMLPYQVDFEEAYYRLADLTPDALYIHCEGIIVFANAAAVRLFLADNPNQLIGKSVRTLLHPDHHEESSAVINKKYLRLDGIVLFVEQRTSAFSLGGRAAEQVMLRTWTEQQRTGEGPGASREFLSTVFDSISDPLFVRNEEHRLVLVNEAYCRFLGRARNDLLGKSPSEIYPPDLSQEMIRKDKKILRSGAEEILEEQMTDAAGQPRLFLTKKSLHSDSRGNRFIVGIAQDITERKETEELLLRTKREWEETFDTLSEAITVHDKDFNIVRANKAAEKTLNSSLSGILNRKCYESFHGTAEAPRQCPSCAVLKNGIPTVVEMQEPHLGKYLELKALPRFDQCNRISGVVHIVKDITNQKKAEEEQKKLHTQLIQAQKMESIGRLAGGIAHDFNNILSTILGYSELALMRLDSADPLTRQIKSINEAGERAAALTRQLLAFSRKQVLEMKVVDLNLVIKHMAGMLCRVIGEDVRLELGLKADPGAVCADPNQIEQVLMNLSVNARDAMPAGGKLFIGTANVRFTEPSLPHHPEMRPGSYVSIAVSDTGTGMSREVREKIFEPFFTTKDLGKGTGLGLATVYGIVKQHNGFIYVYSEPEAGTAFRIYLPCSARAVQQARENEASPLAGGSETIMIVDDDSSIRKLAVDILSPLGYRILVAASGEDALNICGSHPETIDVVLTDVIMPGMHGKDLAERLEQESPGTRVIFMSGYTDEMIAHHGVLGQNVNFVQKPFTPTLLTKKLRSVLDQ